MAEKKCKHCAMMIPKDAKICPHCRKKLGWTLPAKIVLGLIVLGVIGSFLGKSDLPTKKDDAQIAPTKVTSEARPIPIPDPAAKKEANFTLIDWAWEQGEYKNNYIAGRVKNNTNKTYNYAQISFNLYDKSDAQVGSALANINNFEAGGVWKFRAIVLSENAVTAKFKGISAF
jgi:hypothetical protein